MIKLLFCDLLVSSIARESKTVLDYGFHAANSGSHLLDSSLCQWNLDFEFQSLVWFGIPWAVFRIPRPGFRIPQAKISRTLQFGFPYYSYLKTTPLQCLFCLFVCLFSPRCLLSSRFLNFYKSNLAPCKVKIWFPGSWNFFLFWIPESAKFLLVGSEILGFGISGLSQGIRNPANDWNLESKFHGKGIRNPITRTRNKQRGIQNPVLNYLTWSVWE